MPRADTPTPRRRLRAVQPADLQGLSRLVIDGTLGIVDLVESLHHTIARGTGIVGRAPAGPTTGITGLVYRAVRGGTRLTGHGLDAVLGQVVQRLEPGASSPAREATLAVLNGVFGDHLEASGNPLALPMRLRCEGHALELERSALAARFAPHATRLLVLVHGLCMNDLQWTRDGHDHGQHLAAVLGLTPLYLHYNTGRHVSSNGTDLAQLLEQLVTQWPVPVTELVIVGHSMGGLVTRSAVHQAAALGRRWPGLLRAQVFLGTPHHAAPFARLGLARSAGIADLRFGNLQDADWQGHARHAQHRDDRVPTPLPAGVDTYLLAATTAQHPGSLRSTLLGDGLVRVRSALGQHRDPAKALAVPAERQRVITGANHWDLLGRPEVGEQLVEWLR